MKLRAVIFALALLAGSAVTAWMLFWPTPPAPQPPVAQLVGSTMGCSWSVRLGKPLDARTADVLRQNVQATLDRIDYQMSTWKPDSDLSRFNAYRGADWFEVDSALVTVVDCASAVSRQTDGAFDVTVGPVVNLWGFGPPPPATVPSDRVPATRYIDEALSHVGYEKVRTRPDKPALRKTDPLVYVDLSGIAKGFAVDQVAEQLLAAGVSDFLVDVGGEARAAGVSGRGEPWRVGVQAPVPDSHQPLRGVFLDNRAMATSGDYQNFFDAGGKRFNHEIDPRTGRPTDNALASVSVADSSCARADALATALMVLGPDAGYALATRRDWAAMFVIRTGGGFELRFTPAFKPLLITPDRAAKPGSAPASCSD